MLYKSHIKCSSQRSPLPPFFQHGDVVPQLTLLPFYTIFCPYVSENQDNKVQYTIKSCCECNKLTVHTKCPCTVVTVMTGTEAQAVLTENDIPGTILPEPLQCRSYGGGLFAEQSEHQPFNWMASYWCIDITSNIDSHR